MKTVQVEPNPQTDISPLLSDSKSQRNNDTIDAIKNSLDSDSKIEINLSNIPTDQQKVFE